MRPSHLFVATVLAMPLVAVNQPVAVWAAPSRCGGQAATVVGTGGTVKGTSGDDVIVAEDAQLVRGGRGDDIICVSSTSVGGGSFVVAGAGDDTVYTRGAGSYYNVGLGPGADLFVGGRGTSDTVKTGDKGDVAKGLAPSRDVVKGSNGQDQVTSGVRGSINTDVVVLRGRQGQVDYAGLPRGRVDLTGDYASVDFAADEGAWDLDLGAGPSTVDGEAFELSAPTVDLSKVRWSSLDVRGSATDETVSIFGKDTARGPVNVNLRGGADIVNAYAPLSGTVSGGPGDDSLLMRGPVTRSRPVAAIRARLDNGTVRSEDGTRLDVSGFEGYELRDYLTVAFQGSSRPEQVFTTACVTRIQGGGGADILRGYALFGRRCAEPQKGVLILGQGGDDRLVGFRGRDVLIGGRGDDRAVGHEGRDRCSAEAKVTC
ncbi:hypothetical protein BH09ACT12_BH09ACT12_04260 [soil metagenome]